MKFGTLAGEQSRELVLEAAVDPAVFDAGTPIAEVSLKYADSVTKSQESRTRKVVVGFTEDKGIAEKSRDADIVTVAEIYRNNEESEKALALADQGSYRECRTQLKSQIANLEKLKKEAPKSRQLAVQEEIDALSAAESQLDDANGLGSTGRKQFQSQIYTRRNSKQAVK
ncbi:MAG: hypothetical protein HKN23_13565 [Verrucomicrobiales bacterium]|nr:hypothetical protein [Verrucomicrobiales bacterium]